MDFRIADTFTDSLGRLSNEEQKAVKTTAFDLQLDPANPGMQFHKLDRAKDSRFWSVRVSRDIRLIVHRTDESLLLCYVDHHDAAYRWAERRKLEIHPKTGAAQMVEIRETFREVEVPVFVAAEPAVDEKPLLFVGRSEDEILSWGVPQEWVDEVYAADEDSILELVDHLPGEAAEALLEVATGGQPQVSEALVGATNPFDHPDASRRFRVMTNVEELEQALDYPWDKWTVFLHPAQREWVERDYSGPARVSGSAGTGKTVVALHRAVWLARRNPEARVLLATFSDALANSLRNQLFRLIRSQPRLGERIEAHSMDAIGLRLYKMQLGNPTIAGGELIEQLLKEGASGIDNFRFSLHFLRTEWEQVVDAWQLRTWEQYRDVARLGRKTRLPETQRATLWTVFSHVQEQLDAKGVVTPSQVFSELALHYATQPHSPFEHVVVDEAQDITVAQLRFLSAIGDGRPNCLFFAGDLGQRIFQQPFSWKALGVDVRGRSRTLRVNYRTSHQIRQQADRLLGPQLADVDGITEDRSGTVSVFNGPPPTVRILDTADDEIKVVAEWLSECCSEGLLPREIGVFVRSPAEFERALAAVDAAGLDVRVLDDTVDTDDGFVSISTMHLAKGLEFRAVVVMACDDEVLPLQERIEAVTDDSDLEEVYNTERHLLYVACTRARDRLLVTGVDPASEFLDDLRQ